MVPEADIVLFCCAETKKVTFQQQAAAVFASMICCRGELLQKRCQKDGFSAEKLKKYIQILKKSTLEEQYFCAILKAGGHQEVLI